MTSHSNHRIYLVGMMSVGKTSLGKQLASQLHYSFIDLDKQIEMKAGASISELFENEGELFFREMEKAVLHETASRDHVVIATGGGTPCFYDNMEWMNQVGKTVYLKATVAFLCSRLGGTNHKRPLLVNVPPNELPTFLTNLLEAREPYYNRSQVTIQMPVKSLVQAL
ncbi:MAG: shikimate kinase [Bacteroidia bacterium]|jgi:shikimate kinase|nr:shikimate kinase [Bacteroidia bacterium]